LLVALCAAHIVWVNPAPRINNSGLKYPYPCGGYSFFGAGQPVTTLRPGLQILVLQNTVNHRIAPSRFAISMNDDNGYDSHVLITHVPYPASVDVTSNPMLVVLDIPNINCSRCSLQVLNIMTDDIATGACCRYPDNVTSTVSGQLCPAVYHSCANIIINGTGGPDALPTNDPLSPPLPNLWTQEATQYALSVSPSGYILNESYVSFASNQCSCASDVCVKTSAVGPTVSPLYVNSNVPQSSLATTSTVAPPSGSPATTSVSIGGPTALTQSTSIVLTGSSSSSTTSGSTAATSNKSASTVGLSVAAILLSALLD